VSAPAIVSPFSLLDGAIGVLSLLATLWIGLRVKRYIGTIEDYLVANRGMGLYVGAASLLSTEVGIITYMYQAQFGFVAGFSAFATGLITLGVCLVVGRTGFVITRLREMEILTVPEYFETRYGRSVRILAGVLMAFGGSLNLGIFPIIEARFLAVVTGIPSQYLGWTMAGLLAVALAYTALGGMVSLIVTNYVQYVFLAAGTVIVTLACLRHVGWSGMVGAVEGHMGGHGWNPIQDLGIGFILWQILLWIALMTVWQSVAMRTFSTKDAAIGKKMFTLTGFLFLGRALIPMVWGISALAFFWGRAEPVAAPVAGTKLAQMEQLDARLGETFRRDLDEGRLERALPQVDLLERLAREEKLRIAATAARDDDAAGRSAAAERFEDGAKDRRGEIGLLAMPWMLAAILPTGILGLVVAGMLAASISTYAGYFLGWSSIIAQDIVAPLLSSRGTPVGPVPRDPPAPVSADPLRVRSRQHAQGFASEPGSDGAPRDDTPLEPIPSAPHPGDGGGPHRVHHDLEPRVRPAGAGLLLPAGHGEPLHGPDADRGRGRALLAPGFRDGRDPGLPPRGRGLARLPRPVPRPRRGDGREPELGARGGRVRDRFAARSTGPARGPARGRRAGTGGTAMTWPLFWLVTFVVAFGAFSLISLVIAIRGVAEIRGLFSALEEEMRRKRSREEPKQPWPTS
jgi:Na+/proline symporter